jgi:hypothetical protein
MVEIWELQEGQEVIPIAAVLHRPCEDPRGSPRIGEQSELTVGFSSGRAFQETTAFAS